MWWAGEKVLQPLARFLNKDANQERFKRWQTFRITSVLLCGEVHQKKKNHCRMFSHNISLLILSSSVWVKLQRKICLKGQKLYSEKAFLIIYNDHNKNDQSSKELRSRFVAVKAPVLVAS